jgi:uncharacterized protein YecT (DUF1311 family)
MIYEPPLRFEPAATPRRASRHILVPGLMVAALAGVGAGVWTRPPAAVPDTSRPTAARPGAGMRIVSSPAVAAPISAAVTPTVAATGPAPQPPGIQASFDCAEALGEAEILVCSDARLAAADRRMARALRAALDAGAPAWRLRRDQRDWLAARDAAAREAPGEVAGLYGQRIEELESIAQGAGPDRW